MTLPVEYSTLSSKKRKAVREAYTCLQEGICPLCSCSLEDSPSNDALSLVLDLSRFPPNFLKYPIHLHHNHDTDLTIGAFHAHCNGVLFQYFGE